MRTYWHTYLLAALGLAILMVAAESALSNGLLDEDSTLVVPFDLGDTGLVSAATASISLFECTATYKGAFFTFEIDVFSSSWRPVYAIDITGLEGTTMEAIELPPGWSVDVSPRGLDSISEVLSFSTDSNPIMPGTKLSGFTVLSNSNRAVIRWYPTDKAGILLGKVTKSEFQCPSAVVPGTWGAIKSVYR